MINFNRIKKTILLLSLILLFATSNIAFCDTPSSNFPTKEQAEQLIRLLDRDEIHEFNKQMNLGLQDYDTNLQNTTTQSNPLLQTLLLAIAINVTVILITRFGYILWDTIRDSAAIAAVGSFSEFLLEQAKVAAAGSFSDFLLEQARVAAINRIRTLTPEQLNTAINIINNIIENRPQSASAA